LGDTISFGPYTLMTTYPSEYFLVKYDRNGNVLWAKESLTIPTVNTGGEEIIEVASDNIGNAYLTGSFSGILVFGIDTLTNNISSNCASFLVKYSPSGNVLWAKQSVNPTTNDLAEARSVITDQSCNPYIAGTFSGIVKFGNTVVYPTGSANPYITKYDSNGNVLWVKQASSGWVATSLASDKMNHIYLGGVYEETPPPDITFGSYTLYANPWDQYASFFMKFDTSGNPICGSILNGTDPTTVYITSDSTGNYTYLGGTFFNDTVFCAADTFIALAGAIDIFVGRWQSCSQEEGINELTAKSYELKVFPNPFTNSTTLSINAAGNYYLELYDLTGRTLKQIEFTGNEYTLSAEGLAKGMYFVRVFDKQNNVTGMSKLIVQ
jgi:hypothetical protein